jgi:hypothetical protein
MESCDDKMPSGPFCEEVASHELTGASFKNVFLSLYSAIHPVSEPNQSSCKIDDADFLEPTLNWKVFMGAQLAGMIILTLFSLYGHFIL